jgi:hypothetical protein
VTTLAETVYLVAGIATATVAWLGDRRRPQNRRGRGPLVPLAITLVVAGDVLRSTLGWLTGEVPTASAADALSLAGLAVVGAVALSGRIGGRRRAGSRSYAVLDGLAALAVAGLLVVTSSVAGTLAGHGVPPAGRVALIAHPVVDAVVIGLLAWRLVLQGRVRPVTGALVLAVGCWLAADLDRLLQAAGHETPDATVAARIAGLALAAVVPWVAQSAPEDTRDHGGEGEPGDPRPRTRRCGRASATVPGGSSSTSPPSPPPRSSSSSPGAGVPRSTRSPGSWSGACCWS